MPEPALGDRDVLVQVKAASANQLDEKIRLGEFKQILPYWLPLILGNDLPALLLPSGLSCGRSGPGTRCMPGPTRTGSGTFAERIAIAKADLALTPSSASMEAAASLPLVALNAWQALAERGNVQPGQKVLITEQGRGPRQGRHQPRMTEPASPTIPRTTTCRTSSWTADGYRDAGRGLEPVRIASAPRQMRHPHR